jgi:PAS domain S-box-containing protein
VRSQPNESIIQRDARRRLEDRPRLSPALAYTVAAAIAGLAVILRLLLDPEWGDKYPFIFFFPAIALSSWLGGLRPGLLTTLLCFAASAYFWLPPVGSFAVANPSDLAALIVLSLIGVLISALNEGWHHETTKVLRSQERLRVTLTSIGDAVITTDTAGRVVHLNAVAQSLTGWSAADAIGRRLEDVFVIVNEQTRRPAENPVQRVLTEGVITSLANPTLLLAKDGREVPVEDSAAPIRMADGLIGVILVFRDVTQRRQSERERDILHAREKHARTQAEAAKVAAEEANRMKDSFLATLSHELRTPLQSILSYVYLLRSGTLTHERSVEILDAVQRSAQVQTRLIESLLDLSRIEAGKLDLRMDHVDLAKIVSAAVDVVRPEAESKHQTINVVLPEEPLGIVADPARLQQIVWNLLANAVKFSAPGGRIEIQVEQCDVSARLRVVDNGQGIDPDFLPHVFDRFSQSSRTSDPTSRGLGLGLAIVRELVKAHGGTVSAESAGERQGSVFTVVLPLRRESQQEQGTSLRQRDSLGSQAATDA